jgi:hypothetical protein
VQLSPSFFRSHKGKILIVIGLLLAIAIVSVNVLTLRFLEGQIVSVVQQQAMVLARTMEVGVNIFMMEGSPNKLDSIVEFAADAPDVVSVRIVDDEGVITASSVGGENGYPVRKEVMPYLTGKAADVQVDRDDEYGGSVHLFLPIINKEQCHSCHDASMATNGALDVRLAMGEALRPLNDNRKYMLAFTALTVLALFGALYLIFKAS